MSTITVANGKPISSISTTASLSDADKFLISRGLANFAISYSSFKTELSSDLGISLPLTTNGDMIIRSGGSNVRLGIGTTGQVLSVSGGLPSWQTLSLYTDPLTTNGDIIRRAGGITTRLAAGTNGQVLTISSGLPIWSTPATGGLSDPLTINGDLIARLSGVTTRLGVGTNGQYLKVSSGIPAWETVNIFTDPLTTNGDIVIRAAGTSTRLGIGTSGQVLTVNSGLPSWTTLSTFTDPLTTNGDIVARLSGVTTRFPIGTNGQYLSIAGGVPSWVDAPFLDTPVISGTATYYTKFATASTIGNSTTYEDGTGTHLTNDLLVKEGSATSSVKLGSEANNSAASNSKITTAAGTLQLSQNFDNTYSGQPSSAVKLDSDGVRLMHSSNASTPPSSIALFNSNQALITKDTEITGDLSVSGSVIINGSVLDVNSNTLEIKSSSGIKTVSPLNSIINASSGEWKLGKLQTDGTSMTISATDYLEVDVDGVKYKLAIIGSGGGAGGGAVTTFLINFAGAYVAGSSVSVYTAVTSTATPPVIGEYTFAFTIDGASPTPSISDNIIEDYYLWIYHTTTSSEGVFSTSVAVPEAGGAGDGFSNSKSFQITSAVNITLTTGGGA
jgi:hypothetical protein